MKFHVEGKEKEITGCMGGVAEVGKRGFLETVTKMVLSRSRSHEHVTRKGLHRLLEGDARWLGKKHTREVTLCEKEGKGGEGLSVRRKRNSGCSASDRDDTPVSRREGRNKTLVEKKDISVARGGGQDYLLAK